MGVQDREWYWKAWREREQAREPRHFPKQPRRGDRTPLGRWLKAELRRRQRVVPRWVTVFLWVPLLMVAGRALWALWDWSPALRFYVRMYLSDMAQLLGRW